MAYVTIKELRNGIEDQSLRQLSNDATGETQVDEVLNELIYDAQSLMDSYIGIRYGVPLTEPVPRVVRDHCIGIVDYLLRSRRAWTVSDQVRQRYEDAISWLNKIAKGLALIPGTEEAGRVGAGAYFGAQTRIFQGVSHDNETDKLGGF